MARVLFVDDRADVREMVELLLSSQSFAVDLAIDGVDALERLADAAPDAIVTDLEMPRMDGLDLARELRRRRELEAVPIVLLTAFEDIDPRVDDVRRLPGTSVVSKSRINELVGHLRGVLTSGS